jgi:hypothetical protein
MPLPTLAYRLIGRFSVTGFALVRHPGLYRRTGGAGLLGRSLGARTILLTTTGRRSGRRASAIYPGDHPYRRESPIHIPIVVLEPESGR